MEKKKGGKLKFIVIGVLIVVVIGAALSGGDDTEKATSNNAVNSETDSAKGNDSAEENMSTPEEPENDDASVDEYADKSTFTVGETADYKDVQIAFLEFEESAGDDWSVPEEGNIFVYAHFEISNNSSDELSISSMISFEGYCDDYKLEYSSNANIMDTSRQTLDGSVIAGKKLDGYIGFEVPSDWQNIEIFYTDNFWSESKFNFIITK